MPFRMLVLMAALYGAALPQDGSLDPAFSKVPFDEWLTGSGAGRFRWSVHASHAELSIHQRLVIELEMKVDGADLEERRGKGELVTFIQLTDADGRRYQSHGVIDLTKVEAGVKSNYITYTQYAFILPGEYRLAVAIYDTATGEHSARQDRVRVAPLRTDPLPNAWHGLPPVEYIPASQQPESWYLPTITGRLYLPVTPKHPTRIEVIANLSPSEHPQRGRRTSTWNPGILIPAFKALSEIHVQPGQLNVELVDILRRRVVFLQSGLGELNWPEMKEGLAESSTGTIDLKALEDRHHDLAFFVSELNKRIAGESGAPRAIIVLSNIMEFESSQNLETAHLNPSPGMPPVLHPHPFAPAAVIRPGNAGAWTPDGSGRPVPFMLENPIDQLEPVLKPLSPREFDVVYPDQLRKALAAILADIATM